MPKKAELDLIFLGDSKVGKTEFINGCVKTKRKTSHTTIAIEYLRTEIKYEEFTAKIRIRDTAGSAPLRSVLRDCYQGGSGAIIMFDITNRVSFLNIPKWLDELQAYAAEDIEILLIGNKVDYEDERKVSRREASDFAAREGIPYMECSAATETNVKETLHILCSKILATMQSHVNDEISCGSGSDNESNSTKKTRSRPTNSIVLRARNHVPKKQSQTSCNC
mmetsp:Transcript_47809/g.55065  ORF Transcript_47809/g.55065 Transcript_47809/m.55065 type:complete len:222 (+) Transcript_47809:147-812(+)